MIKIGSLKSALALVLVTFLSEVAFAGSLTGTLDNNRGSVYDEFFLTLTAEGRDLGHLSDPPDVPGLSIQFSGQGSNTSNINGRITNEVQLTFLITTDKPGTYRIPSFSMDIDGRTERSLPLDLVVSANPDPDGAGNEKIFIERVLSKKQVYVGEPLLSTIKIYRRVNWSQPSRVDKPSDQFQRIDIKEQKSYRKVKGSFKYEVIEIKEILIPKVSGDIKLEPFRLHAQVPDERRPKRQRRGFFDLLNTQPMKRFSASSRTDEVKVLPLPIAGRPIDFSGLVGKFSLKAQLSHQEVKRGDTVTLTLEVKGQGQSKGMKPPVLSFPQNIKVYQDKPEMESSVSSQFGIVSKNTFKYALVPDGSGMIDLGTATVSIFDTEEGSYKNLEVNLGSLKVLQSQEEAQNAESTVSPVTSKVQQHDVKVLGDDIVGPHRNRDGDTVHGLTASDDVLLFIFPGLGGFFLLIGFVLNTLRSNVSEKKSRKRVLLALKNYQKKNQDIKSFLNEGNIEKASQSLQQAFKEYIGDKKGVVGGSLTTVDIQSHLSDYKLSEETMNVLNSVLTSFDALNYGVLTADRSRIEDWVEKLDRVTKEVDAR